MEGVRADLEAHLRGEMDLDALRASVDRALVEDPGSVAQCLIEIRELYTKGRVPTRLLADFEHRVATAAPRRPGIPSPTPPSHARRVVQPAPSDALTVVARPGLSRAVSEREPQSGGMREATEQTDRTGAQSVAPSLREYGGGSSEFQGATRVANGSSNHPPQAREPTVGQVLKGRFELEEILGRGGMSVVFKAKDRRKVEALDRHPYVALKLLNESFKRYPESPKILQREARKAQGIKHPNVINVFDFDKDENDNYFIAMELLSGSPLDHVIRDLRLQGGMEPHKAYSLIEQMGLALASAHNQKPPIVHSDFKPGNVFLSDDNEIKVFDFGIARAARPAGSEGQTEVTKVDIGALGAMTPAYASPEMFAGLEPDPRDDIYALAIVAYQLLSGCRPFGPAAEAITKGLRPKRIKALSRRQWRGLEKALAFERERRTSSVEEFLDDLRVRKSKIPLYLVAGFAVFGLAALLFFAVDRWQEWQRQEAIEKQVAIAAIDQLPDLVQSAADMPEAARMRIYTQASGRLWRPIVDGNAAEAADALEIAGGLPRPIQETVYARVQETFVTRLLGADKEVVAQASAHAARLPPALAGDVFAAASDRMVAEIAVADAASIAVLIESVEVLPPERRRQVYDRAKRPILDYFKASSRQAFSPQERRYDYAGARIVLDRAVALYPDSKTIDDERARLKGDYEQALSDLGAELKHLVAEGRLLPSETAEDVPDILGELARLDPDGYAIASGDLASAYRDRARAATRDGDFVTARAYLDTGLRLFPENTALRNDQNSLALARERQLEEDELMVVKKRIRQGLPRMESRQDHRRMSEDLQRLETLRPKDALLSETRSRLEQFFEREFMPLLDARDWDAAAALIGDYASLLPPESLAPARRHLDEARSELEHQVARLSEGIAEKARDGRLDDAYETLARLVDLSPEDAAVTRGREEVAKAYLTLARELRAGASWERARAVAAQGLARLPQEPFAAWFGSELAEIEGAEVRKRKDRQQRERIAELRHQAEVQHDRGALEEALKLLEQALKLAPEQPDLSSRLDRISSEIDNRDRAARQFGDCAAQFHLNRLSEDTSGTAVACYRQVLELDTDNVEAQAELGRIAKLYIDWVGAALLKYRVEAAERLLTRLRQLAPDHPELPGLSRGLSDIRREMLPEMVALEGSCYQMGSPASEKDREQDERQHEICVKGFSLGKYEVTLREFRRFIEATSYRTDAERNVGGAQGCWAFGDSDQGKAWRYQPWASWHNPNKYHPAQEDHPVTCVSWNDAQAYIDWLNDQTGGSCRLPTEAEWEYAARAGARTSRFWGDGVDQLACLSANVADLAHQWEDGFPCDDSHEWVAPRGSLQANPWGLYDILGNVSEWTCSAYEENYGGTEAECAGPDSDVPRVLRGGSWYSGPKPVRAAYRDRNFPEARYNFIGFRLAQD